MNELIIYEDSYGVRPIHIALVFGAFTAASFLSNGLSNTTLFMLILLLIFLALWGGYWYLFKGLKNQVTISKAKQEVHVTQISLMRRRTTKTYPLDLFDSVRSYITRGKHAVNHVELVTKDTNRGLTVCSFNPSSPDKFWTLVAEAENPKANDLCIRIAHFLAIDNLGFIGHKLTTNQVDMKAPEFIKHIP